MPFMKGAAPIRRTVKYLEQGALVFKDSVRIVTFHFNNNHSSSKGAEDFVFWHFAQMQYKNPNIQLCVLNNMTPSPFVQCFFDSGSKLVLDVDDQDKETILQTVKRIFCKTEETLQAEKLAKEMKTNPANFGYQCTSECICEIPGQVPCSRWVSPPKEQRGKFWLQGKDVEEDD
ncbi:probable 28S ribosomal protein S25, mitochondrial [Aplysia californica]|uniref:Small ribosomal subunit protein mS25 n=1 Tax=Aplysia californica TaxID=6500 RepID=A0ABM1AAF8_APLCA|nr:probable 28S ribosomal protein S25, mitochondrial [Aplysia californica]XP_012943949.1 probable 28S ribosomal protein S25, mitochondrial [Aplysia californica]